MQAHDHAAALDAHGLGGPFVETGDGLAILARALQTEDGLEQELRGAAVAVYEHEAQERVAHILRRQQRAVVESHALADREAVGQSIP